MKGDVWTMINCGAPSGIPQWADYKKNKKG